MFVIYGVTRVHLSAAMAGKQSGQRLVKESRVGAARTKSASSVEELGIDLQRPERGSDEEDAARAAARS